MALSTKFLTFEDCFPWILVELSWPSKYVIFLPPANEVWNKVIFLHLSVILFTVGEYSAGTPPDRYPPGQVPPRQVHSRGGTHPLPGRYTPSPWAGTTPGRYTPGQVHTPFQAGTPPSLWAGTPPDRYTPGQLHPLGSYTPRQVHPPWAGTPSWAGTPPGQVHPNSACWDTVNKRAVRILLECI